MCVLNFSTTFVRNISHSWKHSARYKHYQMCGYHMHRTKYGTFCTNRNRRVASLLYCPYDMRDVTFSQRCPKDSNLQDVTPCCLVSGSAILKAHIAIIYSPRTLKASHSQEPPRTRSPQTQCHILKSMRMRAGIIRYNCQTFYCVYNIHVTVH